MKTFKISKFEVLEKFAKTIPAAEKMLVDWGRDELFVQFDGIHGNYYSIKNILSEFERLAQKESVTVKFLGDTK